MGRLLILNTSFPTPEYLDGNLAGASTIDLGTGDPSKGESKPYAVAPQEWDGVLRVERTFVHCLLPRAMSESPRSVQSEPWGGAMESRPLKLPRLSPEATKHK